MTYLYKDLKEPTRLYIKQCPHCGLKYFGKTVSQNIEKYPGSGKKFEQNLYQKLEISQFELEFLYCYKKLLFWYF